MNGARIICRGIDIMQTASPVSQGGVMPDHGIVPPFPIPGKERDGLSHIGPRQPLLCETIAGKARRRTAFNPAATRCLAPAATRWLAVEQLARGEMACPGDHPRSENHHLAAGRAIDHALRLDV